MLHYVFAPITYWPIYLVNFLLLTQWEAFCSHENRKLSGLALRQCIELGYHRSTRRLRSNYDPLRLEMRKRAFWCAYGIDCSAAINLGRPLGIAYQEIDAEVNDPNTQASNENPS